MINRFVLSAAAMLLVACASDPAPTEQLRLTEQAIAQARAVGAGDQSAELLMAEEKLRQARVAMADESFKEARILSEQAELDGRLAEARVLTLKSQQQVVELNNRINRLRKQLRDQ